MSFLRFGFFLALIFLFQLRADGQTFVDVAQSVGINVVHDGYDVGDETLSAGICWFDYDNDGDLDLYVVMRTRENYLFQNNNGTFTDVAGSVGVEDTDGDGSGVTAADIDNDGDLDLYVANHNQDRIFRNDGGIFTDITASSGILMPESRRGITATFGDYDQDGWLDIYVANHDHAKNGPPQPHEDVLYHNNGDGTFTNATSSLPSQFLEGYAFIGGWTDFDRDCDPDIFLVNDCPFKGNDDHTYLFRNDGGTDPLDWDFVEVSDDYGVNNCDNGMGLAVADYNSDGYLDYYMSDIGEVRFYESDKGQFFYDMAPVNGTGGQDPVDDVSWGTSAFDYDLDGDMDLLLVCGFINKDDCAYTAPNFFYENNNDGTFNEVSETYNLNDSICNRSCAYGDFDNDGDADLAISGVGTPLLIKRNDVPTNQNWVKVNLEGAGDGYTNRDGVGSLITIVDSEGKEQNWEVKAGSSNASGEQITAIFGLGQASQVYELTVRWAGTCESQTLIKIDANQIVTVVEATSRPADPFTFTSFHVKSNGETANLEWSGKNLGNSKYFTVQKSLDGEKFHDISTMKLSPADDQESGVFQSVDNEALPGAAYYRIRHIDENNLTTFSEIKILRNNALSAGLHLSPNPISQDLLTIETGSEFVGSEILVRNINGIPVKSIEITAEKFSVPVNDLSNGVYFFTVMGGGKMITKKLVYMP